MPTTITRLPLPPVIPNCLGPSWQRNEDGTWLLPERTLGWEIIGWIAENLQLDGEPVSLTLEQMRLILWIYAIDEFGRWVYRDLVLQRMKGHGKDPIAAMLCAVEFVGPCRFSHWATAADVARAAKRGLVIEVGDPVAKENVNAWVQVVAVAQEQTKNTMQLLASIFTKACIEKHGIDLNKEKIYAYGAQRRIEISSSSWRAMEGNRPTFVIRNETHHWRPALEGDQLAGVIRRNLGKSKNGSARGMSITNAYSPGENSYAEVQRNAYLAMLEGLVPDTGTMYDSLEAPLGTTLIPPYTRIEDDDGVLMMVVEKYEADGIREAQMVMPDHDTIRFHLRRILMAVRGDAVWLDVDRLIEEILSDEMPAEESKRFYLNSVNLGDDASFNPEDLAATIHPSIAESRRGWEGDPLRVGWSIVAPSDPIAIFGDGSKSNDSTGLVGCRLSDGYTFTIGVWQKPKGERGRNWLAPRDEIDTRVHEAFERFNVVGFWFDPSHTKDDEDETRYWDILVDAWHQQWGDQLQAWAQLSGDRRSSVGWDMTSPQRQVDFVNAVERFTDELESRIFLHDGHPALLDHLRNARRNMTIAGLSISKASRNSKKKIDLAVCAVGARMLRRVIMNAGLPEKPRSRGWYAPVEQ